MNALSQSNDLFACNLIYCLRTCQTPWHSARGRALLPCENLSVRSVATIETPIFKKLVLKCCNDCSH